MHIGIKVPNWGALAGPDAILRTAVAADERGFGSIWVSDHIAFPSGTAAESQPFDGSTPFLDPFAALAFAAAVTQHVQLGTGVYVLPLRNPIAVAKQAGTVDVLSGGRMLLGVGVGWLKAEFDLLGASWPDRGRRSDEAIGTLRACWSGPESDSDEDGRIDMWPRPARPMPVFVGGHTRAALARTVRLGDGWYGSGLSTSEFADITTGLNTALHDERPGERLIIGARVAGVAADVAVEVVGGYRDAGADFVVLDTGHATVDDAVEWIHRTADALRLDGTAPPLISARTWW